MLLGHREDTWYYRCYDCCYFLRWHCADGKCQLIHAERRLTKDSTDNHEISIVVQEPREAGDENVPAEREDSSKLGRIWPGGLLGLEEDQKTCTDGLAEDGSGNERPVSQAEEGQWKRCHHEDE